MKVGVQKVHDNEWLVQIGNAIMRMDRLSVELLSIALEGMLELEEGERYSSFKSYLILGMRLKNISPSDMQLLSRELNHHDLVTLLGYAQDQELTSLILKSMGNLLAKQMELDLLNNPLLEGNEARDALRRVVEKFFEMVGDGRIELLDENTQYI